MLVRKVSGRANLWPCPLLRGGFCGPNWGTQACPSRLASLNKETWSKKRLNINKQTHTQTNTHVKTSSQVMRVRLARISWGQMSEGSAWGKGKQVSGLLRSVGTRCRGWQACKEEGLPQRWLILPPERWEERAGQDEEWQPRVPEHTRCREEASDPPLEDRFKGKDVTLSYRGLEMIV